MISPLLVGSTVHVSFRWDLRTPGGPSSEPSVPPAAGLAAILSSLDALETSIDKLLGAQVETIRFAEGGSGSPPTPGVATSAAPLGLDHNVEPSTLVSTEPANTSTISHPQPQWIGGKGSTSQVTLGGTYDGSQGPSHLAKFKVTSSSVIVDASTQQITVLDTETSQSVTLDVTADQPVAGLYGLTFTFSAGSVNFDDELESITLGDIAPDPGKPLNGTGSNSPLLQPGLSVTAGSFEINGVTINVLADDTIDKVITTINNSSAGVTASYDQGTELFQLTSASPITLANDTSGFLAAMKLDTDGQDEYDEIAIANVPVLSGIASGTFVIDSTSINVDTSTDTLKDLVDRINASSAGVTASYDVGTDKITITGPGQFTLSDSTSGFFTAVGITPGSYGSDGSSGKIRRFVSTKAVAEDLEKLAKAFNGLFAGFQQDVEKEAERIGAALSDSFLSSFSSRFGITSRFALRDRFGVDFSPDERPRAPLYIKSAVFARATSGGHGQLIDFLQQDHEVDLVDGLLPRLKQAVTEAREEILARTSALGAGALVDVVA